MIAVAWALIVVAFVLIVMEAKAVAIEVRVVKRARESEKRVWWQHNCGVVTRYWSAFEPPPRLHVYASEREALQAARAWLAAEIDRRLAEIRQMQSRARALEKREKEKDAGTHGVGGGGKARSLHQAPGGSEKEEQGQDGPGEEGRAAPERPLDAGGGGGDPRPL